MNSLPPCRHWWLKLQNILKCLFRVGKIKKKKKGQKKSYFSLSSVCSPSAKLQFLSLMTKEEQSWGKRRRGCRRLVLVSCSRISAVHSWDHFPRKRRHPPTSPFFANSGTVLAASNALHSPCQSPQDPKQLACFRAGGQRALTAGG